MIGVKDEEKAVNGNGVKTEQRAATTAASKTDEVDDGEGGPCGLPKKCSIL